MPSLHLNVVRINPALEQLSAYSGPGAHQQDLKRKPGVAVDGFGVRPSHKARAIGCLRVVGWSDGAYPKGVSFLVRHAFTFAPVELWFQLVRRWIVSIRHSSSTFIEAPMDPLQPELRLYGRLDAPSVVPASYVERCKTYREAVRMAFALRRIRNMTMRSLAEIAGLPPQHVSDYLNADDGKRRRSLPAERIPAFESGVGNTCVSQWIAMKGKLTVMEEAIATRAAA